MEFHKFGPGITGCSTDKNVVGGKGASLGIMANMDIAVPPGFIIPIEYCNQYWALPSQQRNALIKELVNACFKHFDHMKVEGKYPLMSVRSGAPVSMPGMMDTILNVGLHNKTFPIWEERIGERATLDSYRRLILMLGSTGYGMDHKVLNGPLETYKHESGMADHEVPVNVLQEICKQMLFLFQTQMKLEFPDSLELQLAVAINAVFQSWNSDRAITYRKINKLEHVTGTAVTIQAMAFGNLDDNSGTGVLFTRNPLDGTNETYGEFLVNAQGEDVVAGIRTPEPIAKMDEISNTWAEIRTEIEETCQKLEYMYNDMVDIEFTVEQGKLYILQSRVGKRSAAAAIQIAIDFYGSGLIDSAEVMRRITKTQYKVTKRPMVDPTYKKEPFVTGINASPGVATGKAVMSSEDAVKAKALGHDVILVVEETTPDDIAGMDASVGILTRTGGSTSHAAVVARAMDKPCVCGATDLIDHIIVPGDKVTICGATGRVWINAEVPVLAGSERKQQQFLFDIISGDAYQSVMLQELEEDAIPKKVAINLANNILDGVSSEDLAASIVGLEVFECEIMLDLSAHALEDTAPLRSIFGPDPMKAHYISACNRLFAAASHGTLNASKIVVCRGSKPVQDAFRKAGFVVNKKAETVSDLMSGDAIEITDKFIETVVGSKEALAKLLEALGGAGMKMKAATRDIHPELELFTALAD